MIRLMMVLPTPGVPLSAETIAEFVIKNPDGTSTSSDRKEEGLSRRGWQNAE